MAASLTPHLMMMVAVAAHAVPLSFTLSRSQETPEAVHAVTRKGKIRRAEQSLGLPIKRRARFQAESGVKVSEQLNCL